MLALVQKTENCQYNSDALHGHKVFHLRKSSLESLLRDLENRDLSRYLSLKLPDHLFVIERPNWFQGGPVDDAEVVGVAEILDVLRGCASLIELLDVSKACVSVIYRKPTSRTRLWNESANFSASSRSGLRSTSEVLETTEIAGVVDFVDFTDLIDVVDLIDAADLTDVVDCTDAVDEFEDILGGS